MGNEFMSVHAKLNVLITFMSVLLIMVSVIFGIYVSALLQVSESQKENIQQIENLEYALVH